MTKVNRSKLSVRILWILVLKKMIFSPGRRLKVYQNERVRCDLGRVARD